MSKEQKMFALIEEFEGSRLSARDFCRYKGLLPSTFYYWKKKKARENTGGGFVEITPPHSSGRTLELIYPNGIRLRLEAPQLSLISKLLRLY